MHIFSAESICYSCTMANCSVWDLYTSVVPLYVSGVQLYVRAPEEKT